MHDARHNGDGFIITWDEEAQQSVCELHLVASIKEQSKRYWTTFNAVFVQSLLEHIRCLAESKHSITESCCFRLADFQRSAFTANGLIGAAWFHRRRLACVHVFPSAILLHQTSRVVLAWVQSGLDVYTGRDVPVHVLVLHSRMRLYKRDVHCHWKLHGSDRNAFVIHRIVFCHQTV